MAIADMSPIGLGYPAIFTGEMSKRILDGGKSETRRMIENARVAAPTWARTLRRDPKSPRYWHWSNGEDVQELGGVRCPYGMKGDRLWVREPIEQAKAFAVYSADGTLVRTKPGDEAERLGTYHPWTWKPRKLSGRYMPRACMRTWLNVLDVRAERLQQIDEEGARLEGVEDVYHFRNLWDGINARRGDGYSWDANPFVWVVRFEVRK